MIFEIPAAPIAWKRAGRKGSCYFDQQLEEKQDFAWLVKHQMALKGFECLTSATSLILTYLLPVPASFSKKREKQMEMSVCHKKPDLSNLIKFTEDALNGILWQDDSLIVSICAVKRYSCQPKTIIEIVL